jgi:soluble lytic murein transglycosylase-like protein
MVKLYALKYGINPKIVYGVCMQESRLNPLAARHEKNYMWVFNPALVKPSGCSLDTEFAMQRTSFGVMQVMGAVFREMGFVGWLTEIPGNIEIQLDYGCKFLAQKIKKYGLQEGILAYNAGSPRKDPTGNYVNQYYFDGVLEHSTNYPG